MTMRGVGKPALANRGRSGNREPHSAGAPLPGEGGVVVDVADEDGLLPSVEVEVATANGAGDAPLPDGAIDVSIAGNGHAPVSSPNGSAIPPKERRKLKPRPDMVGGRFRMGCYLQEDLRPVLETARLQLNMTFSDIAELALRDWLAAEGYEVAQGPSVLQ